MHDIQKIKDTESALDTVAIDSTIKEICSVVEDVPFGNSDFQNVTTIVNAEATPERAYRHSALRIMNRLNALNECYYSLKESDLKIRRIDREIEELENERPKNYDLDIEEKRIEKEKILSHYPYTKKLVKDAIREIEVLYPVIQSMGKLSREQFEANEKLHFQLRSEGKVSEELYLDIVNGKLLIQ